MKLTLIIVIVFVSLFGIILISSLVRMFWAKWSSHSNPELRSLLDKMPQDDEKEIEKHLEKIKKIIYEDAKKKHPTYSDQDLKKEVNKVLSKLLLYKKFGDKVKKVTNDKIWYQL